MQAPHLKLTTALVLAALCSAAHAAPLAVFSDKSVFLATTGASAASGPLPNLGIIADGSETVGSITFNQVGTHSIFIGTRGIRVTDWTTLLAGNEIAVNDTENLNLSTAAPVFAFGFDFVEPSIAGSGTGTCFVRPCTDSTFSVTLKSGTTAIDSFQFNVADDIAGFVGVWSSLAFNAVEVRETSGGIDDEFFGQVFTGNVAPVPTAVPVPAALPLLGSALGLLGWMRRRAHQHS